jgi:hypothetical protein
VEKTDSVRSAGNNLEEHPIATDIEKTIKSKIPSRKGPSSGDANRRDDNSPGSETITDSYNTVRETNIENNPNTRPSNGSGIGQTERAKESKSSVPYQSATDKLKKSSGMPSSSASPSRPLSTNSASYKAGKAVGETKANVKNAYEDAKAATKEAWQSGKEKMKETVDNASYNAGVATGKAKASMNETASKAEETADDAKLNYKAGKVVGQVEQTIKNATGSRSFSTKTNIVRADPTQIKYQAAPTTTQTMPREDNYQHTIISPADSSNTPGSDSSSSSSSVSPRSPPTPDSSSLASNRYPGSEDGTAQQIFDSSYDPAKSREQNEQEQRDVRMNTTTADVTRTLSEKLGQAANTVKEIFHNVSESAKQYTGAAKDKYSQVKEKMTMTGSKDGKSFGERMEETMTRVSDQMQGSGERMEERDRLARQQEEEEIRQAAAARPNKEPPHLSKLEASILGQTETRSSSSSSSSGQSKTGQAMKKAGEKLSEAADSIPTGPSSTVRLGTTNPTNARPAPVGSAAGTGRQPQSPQERVDDAKREPPSTTPGL